MPEVCGSREIWSAHPRRSDKLSCECRIASGTAMTGDGDNDTPVQLYPKYLDHEIGAAARDPCGGGIPVGL